MMNYEVKYSIATYTIENQKENLAILGVYDINQLEYNKSIEENVLNLKKNPDEEIIIESSLGGGVGFPGFGSSTNIIMENHKDGLNEYVSKIKEDSIIMFTNSDLYELIPIYILSLYAKKLNKKIICISVGVNKFRGKRICNGFSFLWDNIQMHADESILIDYDLDDENVKNLTKQSETDLFFFNKFSKRLHSLIVK
ncbi:MAG: hypothetical protein U9P72_07920 [Campylobacterota bacterium]|nr:hypothetical protein [Campylobacterota bacterium]